jgi:hypothetical protein
VYEKENSQEAHFYLDNLLREYIKTDEDQRDSKIYNHFVKLRDHTKAYNYLYEDFEYAKQFLKVLLKVDDILPNNEDFVYQRNYPNLLTFLVFDFEEQFHYVNRKQAQLWKTDEFELFEIAIANVRKETIEIKQYIYHDTCKVFVLLEDNFSASYTLLIDSELDFAIGRLGTLVAVPTKGTAFLYPIENNDVMHVIETIYPTIEETFTEDTGAISPGFYWYYKGQYHLFEREWNEDGTITITTPKPLLKLVND